jgi:ADP-ribose pyrophosphatase YjhB (NUDIX family)
MSLVYLPIYGNKNGYYRFSVKALIFDETRTKFLLVQEDNGKWELPGGGLDWGEKPHEGIIREIKEEMGLGVIYISPQPSYVTTAPCDSDGMWCSNIIFEVQLEHLNLTPSSECVAIEFVTKEEALELNLFVTVKKFLEVFSPTNHQNH